MMREREWYFVRLRPDGLLQVQLLDQHGLAVAKANFDHDCTTLEIDGRPIPAAVIQAAKERKTVSDGQYVDPQGRIVSPFSFEAA